MAGCGDECAMDKIAHKLGRRQKARRIGGKIAQGRLVWTWIGDQTEIADCGHGVFKKRTIMSPTPVKAVLRNAGQVVCIIRLAGHHGPEEFMGSCVMIPVIPSVARVECQNKYFGESRVAEPRFGHTPTGKRAVDWDRARSSSG